MDFRRKSLICQGKCHRRGHVSVHHSVTFKEQFGIKICITLQCLFQHIQNRLHLGSTVGPFMPSQGSIQPHFQRLIFQYSQVHILVKVMYFPPQCDLQREVWILQDLHILLVCIAYFSIFFFKMDSRHKVMKDDKLSFPPSFLFI